jgi:hypothetical protein
VALSQFDWKNATPDTAVMKLRRPRDVNQLAKMIADISTRTIIDEVSAPEKDDRMAELGRSGGRKGGAARAAKLTSAQRTESASKAARARWSKA